MLIQNKYFQEFDGEGGDLPSGEASGEETPSYLFGDVTADEAAERWSYIRELPDNLRGFESRVNESVTPVMERLEAIQTKLGSQPVFEPKLDALQKALSDYDPKLAELLVPALAESLKGSMSVTPLGAESLSPHITPMMQQHQQQLVEQMLPVLFDSLPFDPNAIVERNEAGEVQSPKTELQKDFSTWWDQADGPTRKALGTLGLPYVQALQKFGKWRAERLRGKGQAVGEASARLGGAAQPKSGGQRQEPSSSLSSEMDGYKYYLSKKAGAR